MTVTIRVGDCREILGQLPAESVHMVCTSPPYWGLRDYGLPPTIWDGREDCQHVWGDELSQRMRGNVGHQSTLDGGKPERLEVAQQGQFCQLCGAWRGTLGLEPTPEMYCEHLVEIFREVRRVLRADGTVWLNLGSSYASGGRNPNQSHPAQHEVACDTDDREPRDLPTTDHACHHSDDECPGDCQSHQTHSAHNDQLPRGDGVRPSLKDHDNEHWGCEPASLGASVRGVQGSTTPSLCDCVQGACDLEDVASAFPQGFDSSAHGAPGCADRVACTGDIALRQQTSSRHTLGMGPSSLASKPSNIEPTALTLLYSTIKALDVKPKDLIMIPSLVALALQADGWWLRSDIIWAKSNPMPESVTDRPTKAHEYLFLLTKSKTYYYDADAIREPIAESTAGDDRLYREGYEAPRPDRGCPSGRSRGSGLLQPNPAGRNKRTVWTIPTKPFPEAHFATFPPALVKPCVKAGTSERGCCPACGAPWERVTESETKEPLYRKGNKPELVHAYHGLCEARTLGMVSEVTTIGWQPTCTCNAGNPISCTVLDPFAGACTVGLEADRLGRDAELIEMSAEYAEMGARRIKGASPMFAEVELA